MKPSKLIRFVVLLTFLINSTLPAFAQTQPEKKVIKDEVVNITSIEELLPAAETVMLAITSDLNGLITNFHNLDGLQALRKREAASDGKKNVIAERLNEAELFLSSGIKDSKVIDSARIGVAFLMPPLPKDLENLDEKAKAEKAKAVDISNITPIILIETPNIDFAQKARQEFIEFHKEYFAELKQTETDKTFQIKIDQFANGSNGALLGTTYVLCDSTSMQTLLNNYRNRIIEKLADDAQYNQAKQSSASGAGLFVYVNGKAISSALAKIGELGLGGGFSNFLLPGLGAIKTATLSSTFQSNGVVDKLNLSFSDAETASYFEGIFGGPRIEFKSPQYLPKGANVYFSHSLDWGNFLDKIVLPMVAGLGMMDEYQSKVRANSQSTRSADVSKKATKEEVLEHDRIIQEQIKQNEAESKAFAVEMQSMKGAKLEALRKKYTANLDRELGINLREELVRVAGNEIAIAYDFIKKEKPENNSQDKLEENAPARNGFINSSLAAMIAVKDKNGARALLLKLVAHLSGSMGALLGAKPDASVVQIPTEQKSDEQLKQEREQREAGINLAYSMLPKETYKKTELLSIGPFCMGLNDEFLFLSESKETVKKMIDTRESDQSLTTDAEFNAAMTKVSSAGLTRLYVSPKYFDTIGSAVMRDFFNPADLDPIDESQPSPYNFPATIAANIETDKSKIKLEMFTPIGLGGAILMSYFGSTIKGKAEQNENNARMILRALAKAETAHAKKYKTGYAEAAIVLKNKRAGIAPEIFTQEKENYRFKFSLKPNKKGYEAIATPVKYGRNGRQSFFVDESGELRVVDKKGETATGADPLDEMPEVEEAVAGAVTAVARAASEAATEAATPKPRPRPRPRRR